MENDTLDKMDELLVKYLADEATPPEQTMVEEWISLNTINRQYFLHFQQIWNESQKVAATATADENKAWQRFQKKIKTADQAKRKTRIPGWWRVAASILFIAGAAWLTVSIINNQSVSPEMQRITSVNEVIKDTLPDGSVATLNKHSALTYPSSFKGKTRNVKLKGEAFFSVKPDRQKPFIIEANDVQVKVVGTSFNIRTDNGSTEVIVETGMVQVTKNG
ncbi:MAG: FecR family protein, partial [Chitinophagaceae bacterium]